MQDGPGPSSRFFPRSSDSTQFQPFVQRNEAPRIQPLRPPRHDIHLRNRLLSGIPLIDLMAANSASQDGSNAATQQTSTRSPSRPLNPRLANTPRQRPFCSQHGIPPSFLTGSIAWEAGDVQS